MPKLECNELNANALSGSNLSYIGDAYYELIIRKYLISKNITRSKILRQISVEYVSASAHAKIFDVIRNELTKKELEIFNLGRNGASKAHRKNVDRKQYLVSSGFEAIIGYLYLTTDFERLEYIIEKSIEVVEDKK